MQEQVHKPTISVLMSVYNEEEYIREALQSLLDQTVEDFEIIVIDDLSTDQTCQIIEELGDPRIHLVRNTENQGLTKNLNKALSLANGAFIARMDGDDICEKNRFELQLKYMEEHPERMLISCRTRRFGEDTLIWELEDDAEALRCRMLVKPALAHPGFFVRRELFTEQGFRYDESFRQAQDYELVSRVTRKFQIGVCPHILLNYRMHKGQVSSKSSSSQFQNADRVRTFLLAELGISLTEDEWEHYHAFVQELHTENLLDFLSSREILDRIFTANRDQKIYDQETLEKTLKELLCLWIIRNKSRYIWHHTREIWKGDASWRRIYYRMWLKTIRKKIKR